MSAHQEMVELRQDVEGIFTSIKSLVDGQTTEIKDLKSQVGDKLAKAIEEQNQKIEAKLAELKKAQDEYEKRMARKGFLGGGGESGIKSIGQQFINSKNFKDARSNGAYRCERVVLKGTTRQVLSATAIHRKSNDLTSDQLGGLVQEFRWDTIIQNPLRPRKIADQIPSVPVNSNQVEYPEENVVHVLYTELTGAVVATGTTLDVERTAGFYPDQEILLDNGAGLTEAATVGAGRGTGLGVDKDAKQLNLTAGLTNGFPLGAKVTSESFDYTPEAQLKNFSRVEYEPKTANIKTLPTLMNVSKQMLEDFTGLANLLDARMTEFIELSQERQLLYGKGGTNELDGILTHPDILTYNQGAESKLDAIRKAITLATLAFFPVDVVVLHPTDWEEIETDKSPSDGHYIFQQVPLMPGIQTIWRAMIIDTPVIDAGTALVGSFRMGCVRWDRQEIMISMSEHNRDNFEKNMVTMRAELREGFSVLRPKSFVKVTFA